MAVETNLELEYKFDVDPGFDPPDLRSITGRTERLPAQRLVTTYFDTADQRLWARGITLRFRVALEGDPAGVDVDRAVEVDQPGKWTLKLPDRAAPKDGESTSRDELSWTGSRSGIPPEAQSVIAGLVRRAGLEPVVVLTTERRRLLLHDHAEPSEEAGAPWAELDDDLVAVTSGGRQGLRFRQLELELLGEAPPGPEVLRQVLRQLRRAGATPGGGSKYALAAGLEEPGVAGARGGERQARNRPRRVPDLAGAVGQAVGSRLDHLLGWDVRLRAPVPSGDPADLDVEAVHRARVAARRVRAVVKTFGPVLDPVWAKHADADLEWLGQRLGRLRDEDVLAERIRAHSDEPEPEAVEALIGLLRADRHLGAVELCETVTSERYLDLLDRLHAASAAPPLIGDTGGAPAGSLAEVLTSLVTTRWRALQAGIHDLGPRPADDELHHIRVLTKRLRYAAEAVEPWLGKPARRVGSAAESLQSCLGGLNDAVNAARVLRQLASHPSVTPAVAFTAGHLAGRAEVEAAAARRDWPKVAGKLRAGKVVDWLG